MKKLFNAFISVVTLVLMFSQTNHAFSKTKLDGEIQPLGISHKILVLGDSLSAGYGVEINQGWVDLLTRHFALTNNIKVINASVSGEISSGGNARLSRLLSEHQPSIVILELGGNDGLRGLSIKRMQQNLQKMIDISLAAGSKVLLLGMQIPANYGQRYSREFKQVYPALATTNDTTLVPFLLSEIALKPELMQADGIHPNSQAQPQLLNNVLPYLLPMLETK